MSAGAVVLTLAAGGLGGVALKGVFDYFDRKRVWRREDQHRFAAIKQEAYARLPALVRAYEAVWYSAKLADERDEQRALAAALDDADSLEADLDSDADLQALRDRSKAFDNVATCVFTIELVGSENVPTIAVEILKAITTSTYEDPLEIEDLLEAFTRAARRDLGNID